MTYKSSNSADQHKEHEQSASSQQDFTDSQAQQSSQLATQNEEELIRRLAKEDAELERHIDDYSEKTGWHVPYSDEKPVDPVFKDEVNSQDLVAGTSSLAPAADDLIWSAPGIAQFCSSSVFQAVPTAERTATLSKYGITNKHEFTPHERALEAYDEVYEGSVPTYKYAADLLDQQLRWATLLSNQKYRLDAHIALGMLFNLPASDAKKTAEILHKASIHQSGVWVGDMNLTDPSKRWGNPFYTPYLKRRLVDFDGHAISLYYGETKRLSQLDTNKVLDVHLWDQTFELNVVTQQIEREHQPLSHQELHSMHKRIGAELGVNLDPTTVREAITDLALQSPYNPHQRELLRIERHVQPIAIDKLASFLTPNSPTPHANVLVMKWLVNMVRRIMEPGCTQRGVLVAKGAQNIGKSEFARIIAGGNGRVEVCKKGASLGDYKFLRTCHSALIVDLDEISRFTKGQSEDDIKSFLTQNADLLPTPYSSIPQVWQRSFSYYGSCNNDDPLKDPTGNTRYWIWDWGVPAGQSIDIQWLKDNREAILAGALALYRQGFSTELTPEEQAMNDANNSSYTESSAFAEDLAGLLEGRTTTSWDEIEAHLGISSAGDRVNKQIRQEIKDALTELGFSQAKSMTKICPGVNKRCWISTGRAKAKELLPFYEAMKD